MAWFLLNWNPDVWDGISDEEWDAFATTGDDPMEIGANTWSTGNHHDGIHPGDGLFFLRQGRDRGILAVGVATSDIYEDQHYNDPAKTAHYVGYEWLDAKTVDQRLMTEDLLEQVPSVQWNHLYGSGARVPDDAAEQILDMFYGDQARPWLDGVSLPTETGIAYTEGALAMVIVNRYERDPKARDACIEHYGASCVACGFDFAATYGERGAGFIEVHHVVPLSEIGEEHDVDPVSDMRPLCSNCHSMVHRGELITPDELKALIRSQADG